MSNRNEFRTADGEIFLARRLRKDDLSLLKEFGKKLGKTSRILFCPYPWGNEAKLEQSLARAVNNSIQGIDSSFVLLDSNSKPVGHFFLWKSGGNDLSKRFDVDVPELGLAIADSHQGRGLGSLSVQFLQNLARDLKKDAIELTTALDNSGGWNTYVRAGFEHVGNIRNPLEVDVTEAAEGKASVDKYREERQMVYIINAKRRDDVLKYCAFKRNAI